MLKNGFSDLYCFYKISDLIDFSTSLILVLRPYLIKYKFDLQNPVFLTCLIILTYVEEARLGLNLIIDPHLEQKTVFQKD